MRGGVGLVFRKDEGPTPSSFLIVAEVLDAGPAAKSGMIKIGDRLRKIDGVELGSAPDEESPQLPGPHGSPVTLTLERPSRGSFFDPTVGIISYNIKLTRSSSFFPDKLQSTAEAIGAELERKEREARYESRYGGGGGGWYSSGYEKLALMAASMSDTSMDGMESVNVSGTPPRSRGFENPMASLPPMVHTSPFVRPSDISDFVGDGLIGEAEVQVAKDEVENLKQYIQVLQEELAGKRVLEMKVQGLEDSLKQEALEREKLELRMTKEGLREKQLQDEVEALRAEDREVDLKVLVRGKMDQLVREKEILLADLRHQQVQHRSETQVLEERVAVLMREKDEIKIDLRIEADLERKQQQERYQEYHAKTTEAMRSMAQDLADAVREKEEARSALSKFRVGDGVLWEEENRSLKDRGADLGSRLAEEREQREGAQRKADQLAKEVLRLRAELKREGRPVDHLITLAPASPPPPPTAPLGNAASPPWVEESSPMKHVHSPPASASALRAAPPPPPPDSQGERRVRAGAADKTDEIMSLYLNGADKTVVRDAPMTSEEVMCEPAVSGDDDDDEGEEGPFPLGARGHVIEVAVSKARQLPVVENSHEVGSYMVVSFKGCPIGTTPSKGGMLPAWNETFKESAAKDATGLVSIVLYQRRAKAEKTECVGYIAVPLERVMQHGVEEGWYDLLDQDNQPVQGDGGSAEALVRVSCQQPDQLLRSMSGWVRSQLPGSPKDAAVHRFMWQLDPYAGVVKCSKGMATATEMGEEEWRLALDEWAVVDDQGAVRSIAGKVTNGVDGFCFLLAKNEGRETMLVEVNSERKRGFWVTALEANSRQSASETTDRVAETQDMDVDAPVVVEEPKAVVDVWVEGSRNMPEQTVGKTMVCEVQVGKQRRTIMAEAKTKSVAWNRSVQIGVQDAAEMIAITIRELGETEPAVGVSRLSSAAQAASGDGWAGTDGWLALQEGAAPSSEETPEIRVHVGVRPAGEGLCGEVGMMGWMDAVEAVEPRQVFAVLDPYTQDLRLYSDKAAAALGETGRLSGGASKEPLARHGLRSCEVTRLDTTPSHDGSVLISVVPTEGEPGSPVRLVTRSEDEYVRWKNALNRTARNPSKTKLVPKAAPPPSIAAAPIATPAVAVVSRELAPTAHSPPVATAPVEITPAEISKAEYSAPIGLLDIPTKVPKALLEVFVFRAQDLPVPSEPDSPRLVWGVVRVGDETRTTMKLAGGSGAVLWEEVFQVGARGEASDLVTVILWASSPPGEAVCLGHIAVPISRVAASGQEEGWYEVRDRGGQIVKGAKAASMIRAGIVHRAVPPELSSGKARISGWLVMACADEEGAEARPRKVVGVLNAHCEQLQVFDSEADARDGTSPIARTDLPGSHAEATSSFTDELSGVVASERRGGVWQDGFVISRKDAKFHCIVEESRHVASWLEALRVAGSGAQERREARRRSKAAEKPLTSGKQSASEGEAVEVVVERARHLEGAYGKGAVKGFLCSVQLRDQKHATSLSQQTDTPLWKERFSLPVADASADLATVMLHVQSEPGDSAPECIGHIAVPVSRIAKKGKEEGWYDVTSASSTTGELLGTAGGKAGLLVSFRFKGKKDSSV